ANVLLNRSRSRNSAHNRTWRRTCGSSWTRRRQGVKRDLEVDLFRSKRDLLTNHIHCRRHFWGA
ncbi:MAG: hypothetical protein ACK55Z_16525, partial [bacterium]